MNYPIWELTTIGGGTLIALIAVLHVYIAHLAVGGGMFIWLTDLMGFRQNSADIHAYVKKHTRFFLLLTMVLGGMSGVGIWFIISLVHPAATSKLIHLFVFGWAIEWVFFVGEIVALLVYHYYFDELGRKARLTIAFLYALFAWLSLVVIAGILSYMLTPGEWLQTNSFWDGIFNPSYLPSVAFRSFAAAMFAGLFGYVTSVRMPSGKFRDRMIHYCSKWLLYPSVGLLLSGVWYYFAVPEAIRQTTFFLNRDTDQFVTAFGLSSVIVLILGLVLSLRAGRKLQYIATGALLVVGLVWMGGFEYIREIARKPYVIYDVMYSNSIMVEDAPRLSREGVLPNAKWSITGAIDTSDVIAAGKELFKLQCLSCHTVGGMRMDIKLLIQPHEQTGIRSLLAGMGKINTYMPPFVGTVAEREALAAYIGHTLSRVYFAPLPHDHREPQPMELPEFDAAASEFVLLAWNRQGINLVSNCDKWFGMLPTGNTIEAQLIRRGDGIEVVSKSVRLTYDAAPGTGFGGDQLSGEMVLYDETMTYIADQVAVMAFDTSGKYDPYPTLTINAYDEETENLLATTRVTAAVTSVIGCGNCHGRKKAGYGVITDAAAIDILKAHDRNSGTSLYQDALDGNPRLCQSCHADASPDGEAGSGLLGLSASIHGWHANYMPDTGAAACLSCHPAELHGSDLGFRGVHSIAGVTCVDCHGSMDEHAVALLKNESEKPGAARLMRHIVSSIGDYSEEIQPREPWVNMPNCLVCHVDFGRPEEGARAFNEWTTEPEELWSARADDAGTRCAACHGAMHALYPERTKYVEEVVNIQPRQYMGKPYAIGEGDACYVCHMQAMEDPIHHGNMQRDARVRVEHPD